MFLHSLYTTGGDVVQVARSAKYHLCCPSSAQLVLRKEIDDGAVARDFFAEEYKVDYMLATYPKPFIAVLNGITMGGILTSLPG